MTETIFPGPDAYIDLLRNELRLCAQPIAFAAVIAERRLALAREYAGWEPIPGHSISMRRILEEVWDHVSGREMGTDRIGKFESELSEIATLVDPDRYVAFDAYRGIWLLSLATRCCAPGSGIDAVEKVARASLYIAAGCDLSEDYVCDWWLQERWNSLDVQAEARFQNKLAQALRAIPHIGRDTVEDIRRDFVN